MTTTPSLEGSRCGVVGAGRSGLAAAALLRARGAEVVVFDEKPLSAEVAASLPTGCTARFGEQGFALQGLSLVVVSPGVPWAHPDLARARAAGTRVVAEVELASWFLDAPIAAITGTNGKSTTTALLGAMLTCAGRRPFVGGNLGTPLTAAVGGGHDVLVVELSSFQLEGVDTFHAQVAAILNITPDHLDRYPNLTAYADAKARLFARQEPADVAVLNADDPWFAHLRPAARARLRTFGASGDACPTKDGFAIDGHAYRLSKNRALRGDHNCANAMAAALLALGLGLSPQDIQQGLDTFPGLPHRLQIIRSLRDVEWIDDSKATNVESTSVALKAISGPLVWIAGGRGKGAPYAPLAPLLGERLRRSLLIGEDAPRIAAELPSRAEQVGTLEAAVTRASTLAGPGDTVLLSPACASYDQFKNYEARGDRFRDLVQAL